MSGSAERVGAGRAGGSGGKRSGKTAETVFVIDDMADAVDEIGEWLADEGWWPLRETDPERAIELIMANSKPALVLSDVRMPGMSGIELTRRINRGRPEVPVEVILMSAYGEMEIALEGIRAGAHDFVTKPVSFEDLAAVLTRADKELASRLKKHAEAEEAERIRSTGQKLMVALQEAKGVFSSFGTRNQAQNTDRLLRAAKIFEMMRRKRMSRFAGGLDDDEDVSFDILLYCIQQHLMGRPIVLSQALLATSAPASTGTRRVDAMVSRGILVRAPDPADRRRVLIHPTQFAFDEFAGYIEDVMEIGLLSDLDL